MARASTTLTVVTPLALVALAAAVGALAPTVPAHAGGVAAHDFVGVETCRACHQAEWEIWSKGPHARAYDDLREMERRDQRCVQCHTMVPSDLEPGLVGVQCETCHGAGRYYAKDFVMRDEDLRGQLLFQSPNEKTCQRCHTDSTSKIEPFSYKAAVQRIKHWPDPPVESPASPEGAGSDK